MVTEINGHASPLLNICGRGFVTMMGVSQWEMTGSPKMPVGNEMRKN